MREEILIPMTKVNKTTIGTYIQNYLTTNGYVAIPAALGFVTPPYISSGYSLSQTTNFVAGSGTVSFGGGLNLDNLLINTNATINSYAMARKPVYMGNPNPNIDWNNDVIIDVGLHVPAPGAALTNFSKFCVTRNENSQIINAGGYEILFERKGVRLSFSTHNDTTRYYQQGAVSSHSTFTRHYRIIHLAGVSATLYVMDATGAYVQYMQDANPAHLPTGKLTAFWCCQAWNTTTQNQAIYLYYVRILSVPSFNV